MGGRDNECGDGRVGSVLLARDDSGLMGRTEKSGSESQVSVLVEFEFEREKGLNEAVRGDMID